jgi:phosphate/sulfate permease
MSYASSASRGFMIETMSSIVIILGSLQGLPLSTTHCQVGAVVGVGCTETKYLGGKFEPYPEFSMPTDQLGELAGILDPETGELMEQFTFQSGDKTVEEKIYKENFRVQSEVRDEILSSELILEQILSEILILGLRKLKLRDVQILFFGFRGFQSLNP